MRFALTHDKFIFLVFRLVRWKKKRVAVPFGKVFVNIHERKIVTYPSSDRFRSCERAFKIIPIGVEGREYGFAYSCGWKWKMSHNCICAIWCDATNDVRLSAWHMYELITANVDTLSVHCLSSILGCAWMNLSLILFKSVITLSRVSFFVAYHECTKYLNIIFSCSVEHLSIRSQSSRAPNSIESTQSIEWMGRIFAVSEFAFHGKVWCKLKPDSEDDKCSTWSKHSDSSELWAMRELLAFQWD